MIKTIQILLPLVLIIIVTGCINPDLSEKPSTTQTGDLTLHFINVGLGDSELIQFPSGKVMLIDAGEESKGWVVADYLRKQGITKLDAVVASNPSNSNIGGMPKILEEFPVGMYIDNGDSSNQKPFYNSIHTIIDQKKIPYKIVKSGDTIDFDPDVSITVLNPPTTLSNSYDRNSIVIKIIFKNTSVLFMGDISYEEEISIARAAGHSDILKVGYYGNSMTCRQEFLNNVQPKASVIEVLESPSYFLPSKETIARLEQSGSAVYRTDLNGTVIVTMDGENYSVITER